MKTIAVIRTDFPTKFGLPRQSGLIEEIKGRIEFEKDYQIEAAFKGIEKYSHLWVIWETNLSNSKSWSPTVRPPLLGGNKKMGVFATRSPFRPNPIGLSSVKLERVEKTKDKGIVLFVSGVDMADGTPIYDIKPYLVYSDSHPDAVSGFTEDLEERKLDIIIPQKLEKEIPQGKTKELLEVLKGDPRPSYIEDGDRVYGFLFAGVNVKFKVKNNILTLTEISR